MADDTRARLSPPQLREIARNPIDKQIRILNAEVCGVFDEERFEELGEEDV